MNIKLLAAATALISATVGMTPSAHAATTSKTLFLDPSTSCQLSVPTTDTAVRPKATGYRNEGTKSAFVICGTGQLLSGFDGATSLQIQMISFDGANHNVSCTAVNRQTSGVLPIYSTKVAAVDTFGTATVWLAADVGFTGFASSVTCTLPGGVAISGVRLTFPDEIGT